ncbi:MAG: D-aminoacyl-tRNA deacylase [Candidatus Baltobacteraceae bacterium]
MRAVVTRVSSAGVDVDGETVGAIEGGLLVLLGVAAADGDDDARYLARKVFDLRVFRDGTGAMNRSLAEAGGAVLAVSQFTLLGDARRGRRPSFIAAAPPELGRDLYERFVAELRALGATVATGRFGATMAVRSVNDGPVTILLDSRKLF